MLGNDALLHGTPRGRGVSSPGQRNFGLDALRCFAIALVLANHAFLGFFVELGHVAWSGPKAFLSILTMISIEWLFVLSGFLIGAMMIRSFEREATWWKGARSFWLRRWFRTLPNYYLFLLVNILIVSTGVSPLPVGQYSVKFAFFAQNLAWREEVPFFFNEAWSLALDEWFYLLMPILVGIGARLARRTVRTSFVLATATLILVPLLFRLTTPLPANPFAWDQGIRRVTLMHLDATGWGVLAAMTSRWWPGFWSRGVRAKAAVGITLMAAGLLAIEEMFFGAVLPGRLDWHLFTAWPRFPVAFALTLTGAGTFLAFPWIASWPAPSGAVRKAVEGISNYTYSLYLSHFPLMYILTGALSPGAAAIALPILWAQTLVWLGVTVGVSALVYHSFEKPVSDLRDRFTRKVDASPFANPAAPP